MTRFILAKNYIIPPYSEEWWCCGARGCCRPWGAGNTSACGSSSYQVYTLYSTSHISRIFLYFFASGVGFPLYLFFLHYYTWILVTSDRRRESREVRQETWDRTGDMRQKTWDRRQEMWDRRHEIWDRRQETWGRRHYLHGLEVKLLFSRFECCEFMPPCGT